MKKLMLLIKLLLSLPKTLFFNFKTFPFRVAIHLPVLISYNTKISNVRKGSCIINSKISRFMIKVNFTNGSDGVNQSLKNSGFFCIKDEGTIVFNGKANFASGVSIRVDDKGSLVFGSNFDCNRNCFIACRENITIGDNVLFGWSVSIRDSNGHKIYNILDNTIDKNTEPVKIGNHIWVGANVDILKGAEIADDCIIGFNSCVTRKFKERHCTLAGYPAKIVRENVGWVR
ncbi:acyltransferase [Mesobacillus foraminis]|uniref:acyltransferase n=1 Tax=Mesobacillus foraminis TaxID=279826 RepID=UPI001BE8792E|nr:acyltransferase [Mesobacillus foraminis]MBT2756900.1 acyltransferase [Mesobacillus foraminis]